MSKMNELSYDIEQLYIEGYSPRTISVMLECPIDLVYDWLESVDLDTESEELVDTAQI
jgi:transposase